MPEQETNIETTVVPEAGSPADKYGIKIASHAADAVRALIKAGQIESDEVEDHAVACDIIADFVTTALVNFKLSDVYTDDDQTGATKS